MAARGVRGTRCPLSQCARAVMARGWRGGLKGNAALGSVGVSERLALERGVRTGSGAKAAKLLAPDPSLEPRMLEAVFAIPGDLDLPTGGYAYDRRVLALLPKFGVGALPLQLPASFPDPTTADLEETARRLAAIAPHTIILADGLAYGAMPAAVIGRARAPI